MERLHLILACAGQIWQPRLGDPSIGGLGLTVLYIIASLLFVRVLVIGEGWRPRERLMWVIATLVVLFLTFNKQLDLQQLMNWTGRCVAYHEGWFDQRESVQHDFGLTVMALAGAAILLLLWICRGVLTANRGLILGMLLMAAFVFLQVARFEQLAGGAGQAIARLKLHRILEAIALVTLIAAARRKARTLKRGA